MIVRCTNCASAFAVDDEKVANRKFAFTCPKCGTENIFDNRAGEQKTPSEDIIFEEEKEKALEEFPREDTAIEHDPGSEEIFSDEFTEEAALTEKKNINLEIEETPGKEEILFNEEIAFDEEPAAEKPSPAEEEILFDEEITFDEEPAAEKPSPAEEEILFDEEIAFDEEPPAEKPAPAEEEILFDEEIAFDEEPAAEKAAPAEEDILFDEEIAFDEEPAAEKAAPAEEEIIFNDDFIIDESESPEELAKKDEIEDELSDIGLELEGESAGPEESDRDVKMSSQKDIDAMFAGIPSEEEAPAGTAEISAELPEDEITVDLDELDIELEGDLEGPKDELPAFEEEAAGTETSEEPVFDDDITIDMDSLDIDIEEAGDFHKPAPEVELPEAGEEDELVLNIDEFEEGMEAEEIAASAGRGKEISPEDDITLDLDSLDIDLDEGETTAPLYEEMEEEKIIPDETAEEEDLKLNLDEMDVDIEELEAEEPAHAEEEEEDESITIDLDSLDIEVAESNEILTGEMTEEEEKLTLDDAGLTFSELAEEEKISEAAETDEEELSLSLDEIDPELKLQVIGEEAPSDELPLTETVDELPEIDLDEYETAIREEAIPRYEEPDINIEGIDEFEIDEVPVKPGRAADMDILEYEEGPGESYGPEKGSTTFSIDYSLKYSRLGAFLRLIGLYMLSMIPHFIVMLVYTILSGILGFINQIVILSTGHCVEDFSQVTENTMRYFLYIKTNISGIVEDRPIYAGREKIDHQMQLNITYPVKYSRNLAILRLSIIGIWIISIPHFIIMTLLTIVVPFVYLAGIVTVIATRRWPNPLFIFLTRYFRYLTRISSFLLGLTDEYPPFRFD